MAVADADDQGRDLSRDASARCVFRGRRAVDEAAAVVEYVCWQWLCRCEFGRVYVGWDCMGVAGWDGNFCDGDFFVEAYGGSVRADEEIYADIPSVSIWVADACSLPWLTRLCIDSGDMAPVGGAGGVPCCIV
jgi:hypothetical protein